jgi:hypothetical protein
MKFLIVLLFSTACSVFSVAQNPLVKVWDYRFGGNESDQAQCIHQTSDGGYILGGGTVSVIGGNKSSPLVGGCCNSDYWIVKIDSLGNKLWEQDFGGTTTDGFHTVSETSDKGFVLGGYSFSGIGGHKSQNQWGVYDFWILKTDSLGIKEWDRDFGGNYGDELFTIQQTSDKGYLLGGLSASGVSGDKSQATWGGIDFWIVKIDSSGNKVWDKDFGGTLDDVLYKLVQTNDGGYLLGGMTNSGANGDITETNFDTTMVTPDYWIIKIDSMGNKLWDKRYGGSGEDVLYDLCQTEDMGFILGGLSKSPISGNKTESLKDTSLLPLYQGDYWIVKIDSMGNKQWDRDFGGFSEEIDFGSLQQTFDGGYLMAGESLSDIGGDKSANNLGYKQTWVVKTDSLGIKQWDRTLLANGKNASGFAIQTRDGCYAMANYNNSGVAGDKSQPAWNYNFDYWAIKFCDSTLLPVASALGYNFLCPGTCTDLLNMSIYASSYQWFFPGAVPDTSTAMNPTSICYANPGSYDVQLIAFNANGSDTLLLNNYITVYPTPPPQSISQNGDTLFALAGASTYQWYFNGNVISGATDYLYVASLSGDYNVVATDSNGCEVEAAIFNVIADLPSTVDRGLLTIFPNPVGETLFVNSYSLAGTAIEISVYNMLGEKVAAVCCGLSTVDCRLLPPGIYLLEVSGNDKVLRAKFVKE